MMAAPIRSIFLILFSFFACTPGRVLFAAGANASNAKEIKQMLLREKAGQAAREDKRREVLSKLDQLNQNQNQVRKRLLEMAQSQQELTMAAQNLDLEIQKQKEAEVASHQRQILILKIVYRIHRDGILRFAMAGGDLGAMVKRVRVLYRTLRSNSSIAEQMKARSLRLAQSERKLEEARRGMLQLTSELKEQEGLLGTFLEQKKRVLSNLQSDSRRYQVIKEQYQSVHEQVKTLFDGIDKSAATFIGSAHSGEGSSFKSPLEFGMVANRFGKTVHDKFHTVVPHKGIEVVADHKSPVRAVADGKVEFEGWIKGLGNVVVLQHSKGYFSLSAHLFDSSVKSGDTVLQGQLIGSVGDTGTSSRASLYFELRHHGKAVDPLTKFQIPSHLTQASPDSDPSAVVTRAPITDAISGDLNRPATGPDALLPKEASFGD